MLTTNVPYVRLLEPDLAFINDTGEIVEVHGVLPGQTLLWFNVLSLTGDRYLVPEPELTFTTKKYDWVATAEANKRSQLARAQRSYHAIR